MKYQEALKRLNEITKPQFIIIGIKNDRYMNVGEYEIRSDGASFLEELYEKVQDFKNFKVFLMGEEFESEEKIKKDATNYINHQKELIERKKYEELKERFEPSSKS